MTLAFLIGLGFAIITGVFRSIGEVRAETQRKRDARQARVTIDQLTPANDTGEPVSIEHQLAATEDLKRRAVEWFIQTGETPRKAEKIVEAGYRGFIPGGTFQQLLVRCVRTIKPKKIKPR